jgi:mannose-6-phosphate isomerase-like protein (cupin superfamily)
LGTETAPIRAGDAIPIQLNDVHSFENNSGEMLELMVVGISRDNEKRVDVVDGDALARRRN